MRNTVDDKGILHLGVDNDGEEGIMRDEALRTHGDMEIMSVTSSGYDENESPSELSSSVTTQSPWETAPDLPREVSKGSKKDGVGIEEDHDGLLASSEIPPEVKRREGHREATADHSEAARNLALDIDELGNGNETMLLDMLAPKMTRVNPKK